MPSLREEIESRRTFAIISHPDAGKTTLTEKLLLYGGAIQTAGSVKGKQSAKHAVSDWMDIEKQRGISVTSSVLQFRYQGKCINILDTPGHQDFSEDTYRTLMAADSAVMVIDAAKGRGSPDHQAVQGLHPAPTSPSSPSSTRWTREARDPFELMENIEEILGIKTYPMNWPHSAAARASRACSTVPAAAFWPLRATAAPTACGWWTRFRPVWATLPWTSSSAPKPPASGRRHRASGGRCGRNF